MSQRRKDTSDRKVSKVFFWSVISVSFFFATGMFTRRVLAQGADAFGPSGSFAKEKAEASASENVQEGLQDATPKDNLGQFEDDATLDGGGEFADIPETTNAASSVPGGVGRNSMNENGTNLFGNGDLGKDEGVPPVETDADVSGPTAALGAFGKEGAQNGSAAGGSAVSSTQATQPVTGASPVPQAVNATNAPLLEPASLSNNPGALNDAQVLVKDIGQNPSSASADALSGAAPGSKASLGPDTGGSAGSHEEQGGPVSSASEAGGRALSAKSLPQPNEFSGSPPVPGTLRLMAEGEAPEEYKVQAGDTLFDICDQLIDEAGYWPKLWSLNPDIKNPHFIFPGMRLAFYPGDDDTPPFLQVIHEDDVIPIDKGNLDEVELVKERISIHQEQTETSDEVVEVIGPDQVEVGAEMNDSILVSGTIFSGTEARVQVPGFIFSEEKEALGYVLGGRAGEISVGPGGDIVIEPKGQVAQGQVYTILRLQDEIKNPLTDDVVGKLYYFVANVRISRPVGADLLIGRVQDGLLGVKADDLLVDYISTFRTIPMTSSVGSVSAIDATVVAFDSPKKELGGTGYFAFIDKGSAAGVSQGSFVQIYQKPGYSSADSGNAGLPEDWSSVGVMRIVDVTNVGSVGYIVDNTNEIRIGDVTKKP